MRFGVYKTLGAAFAALCVWASTSHSGQFVPNQGNATRLQGRSVSSTAPTDEQCLVYDTGTSAWRPSSCGSGSLAITGGSGATNAVCGNAYVMSGANNNLQLPTTPAADCQIGLLRADGNVTTWVVGGGGDALNFTTTAISQAGGPYQFQVVQYNSGFWFEQQNSGITVYNSAANYGAGELVQDSGAPTKFCHSLTNSNTGNALADHTKWSCVGAGATAPDYRIKGQVSQTSMAGTSLSSIGLLSNVTAIGTGTATVVNDGGRYISYASAASADADAGWDTSSSNSHTEHGLAPILEMRVYVVDVTAIEIFAGWDQQSATADLPLASTRSGIGFAFDDSADTAFWQCVTNDGSTSITKVDSTVALTTNTFYDLKIDWTTAATPLWFINDVRVCSSATSDLPADTQDLKLRALAETEDGTSKTFGVAWAYAKSY